MYSVLMVLFIPYIYLAWKYESSLSLPSLPCPIFVGSPRRSVEVRAANGSVARVDDRPWDSYV